MSDNGFDNDAVDFEEPNGDDNQRHNETHYSDEGSRDGNNDQNNGDKIVKPRTDGGVGVSVNGFIPNVIFISRFALTTTVADIEEFMGKFGAMKEVSIKGSIAFVEYERDEDAAAAKEACHRQPGLGTQNLIVDFKRDVYIPKV